MGTSLPEINWMTIFFCYLLLGLFIFFIAYLESIAKVKDLYYNKQRKLTDYATIIFFSLCGIILFLHSQNLFAEMRIGLGLIFFILKFIFALAIANEADSLGRNKYLWFLLGFLELHFALIALGKGYKLLRVRGQTKDEVIKLNKEISDKKRAINKALENGLINNKQNVEKLEELETNYKIELKNLLKANFQSKLKTALSIGIITPEEYENKKE